MICSRGIYQWRLMPPRRRLVHCLQRLSIIVVLAVGAGWPVMASGQNSGRTQPGRGYPPFNAPVNAAGSAEAPAAADGQASETVGNQTEPYAEFRKPTYVHHRFVLSPDGTRLVLSGKHELKDKAGKAAGSFPFLEMIDVATRSQVALVKETAVYEVMAVSPENAFLAAEDPAARGSVKVWHLKSGKVKAIKTGMQRVLPGGLAFSIDSKSVHALGPDRMMTLPLAGGAPKEVKYESQSVSAAYSPITEVLAVGLSRSKRGKSEVLLYNAGTGEQIKQLTVPGSPMALSFSSDGNYLGVAVAGGTLGVWKAEDWKPLGSVRAAARFDVGQLAVSPNGSVVAARAKGSAKDKAVIVNVSGGGGGGGGGGSGNGHVRVATTDIAFVTPEILAIADKHGPDYVSAATGEATKPPAAPEGQQVDSVPPVTNQASNQVNPPAPVATYPPVASTNRVSTNVAIPEQVTRGAAETTEEKEKYDMKLNLEGKQPFATKVQATIDFLSSSGGSHAISVSQDGRRLAGMQVNQVAVWDLTTGKQLHVFKTEEQIESLALSTDGKILLIESLESEKDDGAAIAWDEEIQRRIAEIDHGEIKMLTWSEARERLFGEY